MIEVYIQEEKFSTQEILKYIESKKLSGAMVSFVGSVRDESFNKNINKLFIENYKKMAEKVISSTVEKAFKKWGLSYCYIVHRYGNLDPLEPIVMIVTCSKHRKEAFAANQFIIDFLKINAPFWKKEDFGNESKWVEQSD